MSLFIIMNYSEKKKYLINLLHKYCTSIQKFCLKIRRKVTIPLCISQYGDTCFRKVWEDDWIAIYNIFSVNSREMKKSCFNTWIPIRCIKNISINNKVLKEYDEGLLLIKASTLLPSLKCVVEVQIHYLTDHEVRYQCSNYPW